MGAYTESDQGPALGHRVWLQQTNQSSTLLRTIASIKLYSFLDYRVGDDIMGQLLLWVY